MYVIVAYDVVEDRRRRRVHKALLGFLVPVQKSVFEGEIPDPRYSELLAVLGREIDRGTDTVRIYRMCARCIPAAAIVGCGVYVEPADQDVLL